MDKNKLPPDVYNICFNRGTEPAFSGKYNQYYESGIYNCVCCGNHLFYSNHKYDSGSGWPSFYECANNDSIIYKEDFSYNMKRTEILCKTCNAHLGHVFDDGPKPTGKRYCINSLALDFKKI